MMRHMLCISLAACAPHIDPGPIPVEQAQAPVRMELQLDADSPNLYLQAMVSAGSGRDATGREGTAALTAHAMAEAGAGTRTAKDIREALYPTGSGLEVRVDKDWVTFRLTCHRDHAALCTEIFTDTLTSPRFESQEVERLRDRAIFAVGDGILSDEERLGEAFLEAVLFEGHPYGHPVLGRGGTLPVVDANGLKDFHRRHYVRQATLVGMAGAADQDLVETLTANLETLPGQLAPEYVPFSPVSVDDRQLAVVATGTDVTGFHLGHPLEIRRDAPDWPALRLAFTAFGAHRQSFGRLFRILRTDRGLNYGTYAYIEAYSERWGSSRPEQGGVRSDPHFYLWVRPTAIDNGPFALKLAIDELERLVRDGLTTDELEAVRSHVQNATPTLATDPGRRLSYALEAIATGTPNLWSDYPQAIATLTLEDVNAALAAHIHPERLRIVAVTGDPEGLTSALTGDGPTPITYADIKPDEAQAARDAEIAHKDLDLAETWTVQADGIFQ